MVVLGIYPLTIKAPYEIILLLKRNTTEKEMMLTTPSQIELFQLVQLKAMIKLEALGMTRRGRSATVVAKELLSLNRSTKREVVLALIVAKIEEGMIAP
jgi:hypothetical protein